LVGIHADVDSPDLIEQNPDEALDPWRAAIDRWPEIRPASLVAAMQRARLATGWVATPIRPPPRKAVNIASAIDLDEEQAWWPPEEVERHYQMLSARHRERLDGLLAAGQRFVGTGFRRKRNGKTHLEVRFDGLAGCLRTPRGGSARQIVVVANEGELKMRWMSAIEYARLQGAERFTMLPNQRQMLFGFGDAVCVPVISWIDGCVLTPLFEACAAVPRESAGTR
jgi:DNA (cytosine-5)-methyltransferase 1